MSSFSTVLRTTTSNGRLLGVAGVVALLEGLLRLGLVTVLDPNFGDVWLVIAVIVWPPVVAVFGLAAVVPSVREAIDDAGDGSGDDATTWRGMAGSLAPRLPPLAVIALVGHVLAIIGGAVLFLVVDTPIRYALYWVGYDDLFAFTVVTFGPLVGIGIGTLVAWTVPAIAVVEIGDGASVGEALRGAITAPVSTPGSCSILAVGHLAFVGFAVGVGLLVTRTADWIDGTAHEVAPVGVVVLLVLGWWVLVCGAASWLAWSLAFTVDRSSIPSRSAGERSWRSVPAVRFVLVVLVVTALVATAGAVRTNEMRPTDTSPASLPEDPDDLYATAYENTDRTSHEFRWSNATAASEELIFELRLDRDRRRMATTVNGIDSYFSTGVLYQGKPVPLPGYAIMVENDVPRLGELSPEAENWTVAAESEGEVTLELTDPDEVHFALHEADLEAVVDDPEVHEAWARMTIDTDRKTLSGGEIRLNVSEPSSSTAAYDFHNAYEYEIGADVERPDELGPPSVGELFWRLFAY